MENKELNTTSKICMLNDEFRRNIFNNDNKNRIVMTQGVNALSYPTIFALLQEVQNFEDFNKNNDPYGEHDFGSIKFKGQEFFFKFDYYDNNLEFASPDASNPNITKRVLTIMQADEY